MPGRTIRFYLVDGTPSGVLVAEIINWTGQVVIAPRAQLAELAARNEIKRTGVYLLVGPDPETPTRDRVYVGEGDDVLKRLVSHDSDDSKEFWTRTIVLISKDHNLTKSHVRFLESRLIRTIQKAGRASLANGTAPDTNPLPEPDVADMEYFLEQVQIVFPLLGLNLLQPPPAQQPPGGGQPASPRFVMNDVGTSATAIESGDEFVVLKGSTARKQGVESWTGYRSLRDDLIAEGKLQDSVDPNYYEFASDVAFTSPSAAASVVAARTTNGRTAWKFEGVGESYAAWHAAKVNKASGL